MAGQNPYKKAMIQITSNTLVKRYLSDLAKTGLYAKKVPGTAHEIIKAEIRRQIEAGNLRRYDGYDEMGPDDGEEDN